MMHFYLLQTYNEYTTGLLQFCYNFVTLHFVDNDVVIVCAGDPVVCCILLIISWIVRIDVVGD